MKFEHSAAPIDVYRRRLQLRHALVTVEAAIALRDQPGQGGSETVNFEGLREDLLVALWLVEVLLAKRRGTQHRPLWPLSATNPAARLAIESQLREIDADADVERALEQINGPAYVIDIVGTAEGTDAEVVLVQEDGDRANI